MQFVAAATTLSPHTTANHHQPPHSHAAPRGTSRLPAFNATHSTGGRGVDTVDGGAPGGSGGSGGSGSGGGGGRAPSRSLPLAVRLAAWREVGGLDPGMEPRGAAAAAAAAAAAGLGGGGSCLGPGGGGAAEVDLSTRLWLAGWQVGADGLGGGEGGGWKGKTRGLGHAHSTAAQGCRVLW